MYFSNVIDKEDRYVHTIKEIDICTIQNTDYIIIPISEIRGLELSLGKNLSFVRSRTK